MTADGHGSDALSGMGRAATGLVLEGRSTEDGALLRVAVEGGVITGLERPPTGASRDWISPGWLDLQVNGFEGHDPNAVGAEASATIGMVRALWAHGVAGVCPTICTQSENHMLAALRAVAEACEQDPLVAASVVGIHVEGPHIATEDGPRGAHPLEHVRRPDVAEYRRWQDAAGGRIRLVTLAPERTGAIPFIERLVAKGIVVALGHTPAGGNAIRAAVDAGARISTHLGNGCAAMLPRHDNPIWHQLANDELLASVIADGHHLPHDVLKSIIRGKTPNRMILTCDASPLAGLPPGRYAEWGSEFDVLANGKIAVPGTPYLAGSGVFTDHCVSHILNATDATVAQAVEMASVRPRQLLSLPVPVVTAGAAMDELVLFRWSRGKPISIL